MPKEFYKSERYFTIWDYSVSHGQLLLRADKRKGFETNIDIIFFDTTFIQLYAFLEGIQIKILDKPVPIKYNSVKKYVGQNENNLFEIETKNEKFYIAASFIKIFENHLEHYESSLIVISKRQGQLIAHFPD